MEKVATRDGYVLDVRISGDGPAIVFLHGWAIGEQAFHRAHTELTSGAKVVTFNQRGHGTQEEVGSAPAIETLADDLSDLMEALDLWDATIVGWSMGSMVLWSALRNPKTAKRIAATVSIDMTPRVTNDASWQLGFADGRTPAETLRAVEVIHSDWPSMVALLGRRIYAEEFVPDPDAQAQLMEPVATLAPGPLASLWESMAVQDHRQMMDKIIHPTWLVQGGRSQLYRPETGAYLKGAIAGSSLTIFEEAGHAPHLEEPDRFYRALRAFHLTHTKAGTPFRIVETKSKV